MFDKLHNGENAESQDEEQSHRRDGQTLQTCTLGAMLGAIKHCEAPKRCNPCCGYALRKVDDLHLLEFTHRLLFQILKQIRWRLLYHVQQLIHGLKPEINEGHENQLRDHLTHLWHK